MKITSAKCPSCGGNLEIPDNKDYITCLYCENTVRVRDAVPVLEIDKVENFAVVGVFKKFAEIHLKFTI
ncbi:MAG TPA: hypothetical protein PLX80_04445 [Ignavibacteria bacterium]|nr:hypothetical protein [Ignavibacteria bacterium]